MAEGRRQDEEAPPLSANGQALAFAGVWEVWSGDGNEPITTFSLVTTSRPPSTAGCHDRMPVVLKESQFDDWMRGPPDLSAEIMKPYGGAIEVWEVGKAIGNVRNKKPELLDHVALI